MKEYHEMMRKVKKILGLSLGDSIALDDYYNYIL